MGKAVIAVAVLLLAVPMLIGALFVGPTTVHERVPMASPSQVKPYQDAAASVGAETGLTIDWRPMLAIDAVRLDQDFSQSNSARAHALAESFVKKTEETVKDPQTGETTTVTHYRLRSGGEVMNLLGLSTEDQAKVQAMLEIDLSQLADIGVPDVPPDWVPHPSPGWTWPVPGVYHLTSGFGPRIDPVEGIDGFHYGLDIGASAGTPIVAAKPGIVIVAGPWGDYGNAVAIKHDDGTSTRYGHMSRVAVRRGQQVNAGDVIGYVGSTGKSTGSHLHFEVRVGDEAVDPLRFFR